MLKRIIQNKKLIMLYLGIILGVIVAAHFFILGINKAKIAEISYNTIKTQVQAETSRISTLGILKQNLLDVEKQWEEVKQPYLFDPEGGSFYNELGTLANKYKIKDISITPHALQKNFYMGHLRALPYDLVIKGSFPNVFNLLSGLEMLNTPAEIKPISIQQQDDGSVLVKTTVFLYSLNPPENKKYVNGESGRYDPFFNPDIQKTLQQQNSANIQNNQSQQDNSNNISQQNNIGTTATQQNNDTSTNTLQAGNNRVIPPYNNSTNTTNK